MLICLKDLTFLHPKELVGPASHIPCFHVSLNNDNSMIITTSHKSNHFSRSISFFSLFCYYCESEKVDPNHTTRPLVAF